VVSAEPEVSAPAALTCSESGDTASLASVDRVSAETAAWVRPSAAKNIRKMAVWANLAAFLIAKCSVPVEFLKS